jgi:hypothetical protein
MRSIQDKTIPWYNLQGLEERDDLTAGIHGENAESITPQTFQARRQTFPKGIAGECGVCAELHTPEAAHKHQNAPFKGAINYL